MKGRSLSRRRWTWGAMALAVTALFLRVLIPAGFMIGPATAGGPPGIVICTGQGAMTLAPDGSLHSEHENAPAAPNSASHDACAFAGAGAPVLTTAALTALEPVPVALDLATPAQLSHQRPGLGLAAPPPPTTGPPHLI